MEGFVAKTWEQMTDPEKIEDLRRDVVRIFKALREFQDAIASDQRKFQSQISELTWKVSALEKGPTIPRKK